MVISKKKKKEKKLSTNKTRKRRPPSCNFVSIFVLPTGRKLCSFRIFEELRFFSEPLTKGLHFLSTQGRGREG
jgi:hypothetical protein